MIVTPRAVTLYGTIDPLLCLMRSVKHPEKAYIVLQRGSAPPGLFRLNEADPQRLGILVEQSQRGF